MLPIGTESNLQESSSEASSDSEDNPEDAGLRLIASHKTELEDMTFGEWEEHTKVGCHDNATDYVLTLL